MFDVPYMREETPRKEDIDYLVSQLWELVHLLEKRTGRAFDMDELKKVLAESRRAEEGWVEFLRAGRLRPSPIEAYFESIFYMFPINVLRGTPEAADFYEVVNEEIRARVREGNYPAPGGEVPGPRRGGPAVHQLPDVLGLLPEVGRRVGGGDLSEGRWAVRPRVPPRPVAAVREHRGVQPRAPTSTSPGRCGGRSSPTT